MKAHNFMKFQLNSNNIEQEKNTIVAESFRERNRCSEVGTISANALLVADSLILRRGIKHGAAWSTGVVLQ
jgi:hypothetical protein